MEEEKKSFLVKEEHLFHLTTHKNMIIKNTAKDYFFVINRKFSNNPKNFEVIKQQDLKNLAEAKLLTKRIAPCRKIVCSMSRAIKIATNIMLKNRVKTQKKSSSKTYPKSSLA